MPDFVSLHNHTHYSILNALSSPKDLFLKAKELGQKAIAVTDLSTFAAAWESLKASKETGLKLIIGCEFNFVNNAEKKDDRIRKIVLLAKNMEGYQNILMMNRKAFDQGLQLTKKLIPLVDWELLKKYSSGTICLTGGGDGIIANLINNKKMQEAEDQLKLLKDIFKDDLGVEIQPNNMIRQANYYNDAINQIFTNFQLIKLAQKLDVKIIPATGSFYINKEDAEVFDVMLAIGSMQPLYSNNRLKFTVPDFYVKTGDEIKAFFERNFGEEFALQICRNTIDFADRCEEPNWIDPKFTNPTGKELPDFPVKDEEDYSVFLEWKQKQSEEFQKLEEDKLYLRYKCYLSLDKKIPKEKYQEYKNRLEEELDVLYFCGVSSYMLIVADYVNYCKKNGIMVGPGRGSVGGSLVAYLLEIHQADPVAYGLVFERFHNKQKQSYSDIDLDFAKEKREQVIEYISNKYGKDNVVQISNYNTLTPKVYCRDLARSCELGGSRQEAVKIGTSIADSIPKDIKNIKSAFEQCALFVEYSKRYPELKKYMTVSEKPRATSIHASGIIIGKRPLTGLIPVKKDKDNIISVEYDKDDAEDNGLVKMDVLGLNTLDIINETNNLIKMSGKEVPGDIDYEVYDKKTYDLISAGNTFCVFQFGTSAGTIDLCKKIKPKNIDDLAIITTLARPSSKDIREDFIKSKRTKKMNKLIHPSLENALKNTYGYSIYDESLLILAKDVAGWDLAEADKLRKLTKEKGKNPEKAKRWEQEFIEGAIKNGLDKETVQKIWDEIVIPYARYSFNKSHAVLYSMISYHTAYLKAHYPIEFLLANLKAEVNSGAKIAKLNIEKIKQEIRSYDVNILPPDINKSDMSYKLIDSKTLLTGLDALRSIGDPAIEEILKERPFNSFFDLMYRTDSSKVRSSSIQALAASGALDSFNIPRHLMFIYCSDYRKKLTTWLKKHDPKTEKFEYIWPEEKEWTKQEIFALERHFIGENMSVNKYEGYGNFFKNNNYVNIKDFINLPKKTQIPSIKGEVKDFFELKVKKEGSKFLGMSMCKIVVEDINGDSISLTIFPDSYKSITEGLRKQYGNKIKLEVGICLHFSANLDEYEGERTLSLSNLYSIAPIPQIPKYVKVEKTIKPTKEIEKKQAQSDINTMSDIEAQMVEEGLIDLDEEFTEV
jgi:DNA polymerase-3 subunit alpha